MKNSFDRLINRLEIAEERISELEDMSIKTTQTEMGRGKIEKIITEYPRTVGHFQNM